ncbi:hypothetical protein [Catenovulum sediminis]|uniref:hypothetical protein n=1 Tax=Catenovulum sediminis TaxID=1740262 RepID=UPI00117E5CDA|nr:hypothetical protein [Catenovulum sediminis]
MKNYLLAATSLLGYLLCGLVLLGVNIPILHPDTVLNAVFKQRFELIFIDISAVYLVQSYFALLVVGAFTRGGFGTYCAQVLYQWDVLIASICHGTKNRSISGLVGERALSGSLRWLAAEAVIDFIFMWDESHCKRTFYWERRMGFVA